MLTQNTGLCKFGENQFSGLDATYRHLKNSLFIFKYPKPDKPTPLTENSKYVIVYNYVYFLYRLL